MKLLLLNILFLAMSCSTPTPTASAFDDHLLIEKKEQILDWAQTCGYGYSCEGQRLNEDHVSLFSGLLCLSSKGAGDFDVHCRAIYDALGSDGKLWRSPSQVDNKVGNSSSKDVYLGFLAANVVLGDHDLLWRSYQYLEDNDFRLCLDADDNRCDLKPNQHKSMFKTIARVWKRAGMRITPTIRRSAYDNVDGDTVLLVQAKTAKPGYQLHLAGIQVLIAQKTERDNSMTAKVAKVLNERQPANPFFAYLRHGATDGVKQMTLDRCPTERPDDYSHWMWSQQDGDQDANSSMGWDCVFLIDLLLSSG